MLCFKYLCIEATTYLIISNNKFENTSDKLRVLFLPNISKHLRIARLEARGVVTGWYIRIAKWKVQNSPPTYLHIL